MKKVTCLLVAAALLPIVQLGAQNTDRDDRDSTQTSTTASAIGFSGGLGGMFISSKRSARCDGCSVEWTSARNGNRTAAVPSGSSHALFFAPSSSEQLEFVPSRSAVLLSDEPGGSPEGSAPYNRVSFAGLGASSVTTSFSNFEGSVGSDEVPLGVAQRDGGGESNSSTAVIPQPASARTLSPNVVDCTALDCVSAPSLTLTGAGAEEEGLFGTEQPLGAQAMMGELPVTVNPEPSTVLLTVAGLAGIFLIRRRVSSGQ